MSKTITVRWLVRQELIREPRFGETKRDVLRWAVRQYVQIDGTRTYSYPTYFGAPGPAAEEARRRCADRYGCTTPNQHDHARSRR
ncbi:MAG: hypothetical protein PIR02_16105 [Microbacterium enclense]